LRLSWFSVSVLMSAHYGTNILIQCLRIIVAQIDEPKGLNNWFLEIYLHVTDMGKDIRNYGLPELDDSGIT
jgi:hypothetical protein